MGRKYCEAPSTDSVRIPPQAPCKDPKHEAPQNDPTNTLRKPRGVFWVAVKEFKLSYYIGETLLFTMYLHYGNLTEVP